MSFLEYETWTCHPGSDMKECDRMFVNWLDYVRDRQKDLFPEWISVKYYRHLNRDGTPTGRYCAIFEYESAEAYDRYKKRRGPWDNLGKGFEDYSKISPCQTFFEVESHTSTYFEPQLEEAWFQRG